MADQTIDVEDLLEYLLKKSGDIRQLAMIISESFRAWFKAEKANAWKSSQPQSKSQGQDTYLRHYAAKSLYEKIQKASKSDSIEDAHASVTIEEMADFIRAVRMPPAEFFAGGSKGPIPFNNFAPGKVVHVCIAKRIGQNVEGQSSPSEGNWKRSVYGSRDVQSLVDLVDVLGHKLRLDYELDLVPVAPVSEEGRMPAWNTAMEEAERELAKLLADSRTGAIIALGSGPHNVMSNVLAKRIFEDFGEDLPVRFRWTSKKSNWRETVDFLRETKDLRKELIQYEAGLWYLLDGQRRFLPRDTDGDVRKLIGTKGNQRRFFSDCGMLAIDARRKIPLVLASGHGGNATRACVQALARTDAISDGMGALKKGRFVSALHVTREKGPNEAIDDLALPEKRRGWYLFGIDQDPPAGVSFAEVPFGRMP